MISKRPLGLAAGFGALALILLLPLPAPIETGEEAIVLTAAGKKTLAVLALAVILWVTEALPFAITGLAALVTLVALKGAPLKELVRDGFGNQIFLFFIGVLILSAAINETPLMQRITSWLLRRLGGKPRLLLLAVLTVGALLSGWITDMAVAAMLLPIGVSILKKMEAKPLESNFGRALMIACAWGPLMGGIATPAGCGPNPLTMGFLRDLAGIQFSFLDWLILGLPATLMMIPCAWVVLLRAFPFEENLTVPLDEAEYGPFGRKEIATIAIFALTVLLWLGAPLLKSWSGGRIDFLSISFTAVACALLFFLPGIEVISWKKAQAAIDWGGIILIVTGLALGMAIYKSGAAQWLAYTMFHRLNVFPPLAIIFLVVVGVSLLKVLFSSNTVTGIIIVPLLIALARQINISPLLVAIPAGMTSSLAFILVTSTPTNVIPYSAGYFSIRDMAKAGLWMTLASGICVTASLAVMGRLFGILEW